MRQQEKPQPSATTKLINFIYFGIVVAAAYYLSGLAVQKLDANGMIDLTIPKADKPVPHWVIQFVIGLIIFFLLQFLLVFLFGLIKGRKKNVYEYTPPKDQSQGWRR